MKSAEKAEFLIVYDCGAGGLWGVMLARSADEIVTDYPELTVLRIAPGG